MKDANVGSKKILKAANPRRAAGVQVRSGVKAGGFYDKWRDKSSGFNERDRNTGLGR